MAQYGLDQKYELEQLSRSLPEDEVDVLRSHSSFAGPNEHAIVEPVNNDPLRKSQSASRVTLATSGSEHQNSGLSPEAPPEEISPAGEGVDSLPHGLHGALQQTPFTVSSEDACNVPLPQTPPNPPSIPLPPSSSSLNLEVSTIHEMLAEYKARTSHLSEQFLHLDKVCSRSRHDKADITVLDYAGSRFHGSRQLQVEFETKKALQRARIEETQIFMCAKSLWPEVDTRLIMLEDIGPTMINLLGAIFKLSPEFFAEHLHRSGYHGDALHELPPSGWRTSNLHKDYVSMEWRRPIKRWLQEPITPSQRTDLLELENARLQGGFGGFTSAQYRLQTTANIFRPEFAMYTNPDGQLPETTPSGWEERVTLCTAELDKIRYGQHTPSTWRISILISHSDNLA